MTNYETSNNREWWVLRWLELLDSYRFKKRLERARNYAREGNVLNINFKGGKVLARVQGSEPDPYQVSLSLDQFSQEDWDYIIEIMSQKAIYSAQLLAGEMPATIEDVFTASGLSLFPFQLSEIHSRCSCPDKANPCKHIGAVYYQLGDRFSEDPFVLFQLRGRTREQILEGLRQVRSQAAGVKSSSEKSASIPLSTEKTSPTATSKTSTDSSALDISQFWQYDEPLESSLVVITPPTDNKTILEILGTIPLASTDALAVREYLEQVYSTAAQQAMITALNPQEAG